MRPWWIRLLRFAPPEKTGLFLVILMMLTGVAIQVLRPWPLKIIVDHVLKAEPLPNSLEWLSALPAASSPSVLLAWLAAATVMLFVGQRIAGVIQTYARAGVASRMAHALGAQLFDHLQRLSIRFHGRKRTGDLVRRITRDSGCMRQLVMGVFVPMLTSIVTLGAMFVVMWQLDRGLSLLSLLVVPPLLVLAKRFDRPMTERNYQHQSLEGEMMALAEQTLTAIPMVQAFGRESEQDRRLRDLSHRTLSAYLRVIFAQMRFKIGVTGVTALGTATMMVVGGMHVLDGRLTLGGLLVFISYLAAMYSPAETLAYLSSSFAAAAAQGRRVLEILEEDDAVVDSPDAVDLPPRPSGRGGHVRIEHVSFGYDEGRTVLSDLTLEAQPGETIAIVGASGAGKSTLASLIARLYDPWEGRVTLDGRDLRDVTLASLRAEVSLVLQDPFLLPLTIAENIAYGHPDALPEAIVSAARAANADEFIRRLPDGYGTPLGERGMTLSGGQRQRIAIARAILRRARVLVFDEATSALDAETERLVLEAVSRAAEGRTTFIIAHRLSTLRYADRIAVLGDQRILESGTHDELVARQGYYRQFCRAERNRAREAKEGCRVRVDHAGESAVADPSSRV